MNPNRKGYLAEAPDFSELDTRSGNVIEQLSSEEKQVIKRNLDIGQDVISFEEVRKNSLGSLFDAIK